MFLLTVSGQPLCLVNARRQGNEGSHVRVSDLQAHILLLEVRTLLQIIVVNSPREYSRDLMSSRETGVVGSIVGRRVQQKRGKRDRWRSVEDSE